MSAVEPVVTDQPDQDATEAAANGGAPVTVPTTGVWGSKLSDCCEDMSSCCLGTWCCLILGYLVSKQMDECCCAGSLGAAALRTKYREQHGIQGSACNDCVSCCFCSWCTVCQLARELKKNQNAAT